MDEHWEFYECTVDDHRAMITVDVTRFDAAPDPERPVVARVTVPFVEPQSSGFHRPEERERLDEIEERIAAAFVELGAVYVGRAIFAGARRHYFYVASDEVGERAARRCRAEVLDRTLAIGGVHDPQWRQYLDFLYPNPLAWQYIRDRYLLDRLDALGDDLDAPRPIHHTARFPSDQARADFIAAIRARGFAVDRTGDDARSDDTGGKPALPFGVAFSQARPPREIVELDEELFRWAEAAGGAYDGWSCDAAGPGTAR